MRLRFVVGQMRKSASGVPLSFVVGVALTASLIGAGLVMAPESAYACYCVEPDSPAEVLSRAATVFSGRVVSVGAYEGQGELRPHTDQVVVEFEVVTFWKGYYRPTVYLTAPGSGSSCGVVFVEDEEYLVYSEDGMQVSLCSRIRLLSEAADDLAALGEGRFPASEEIGPTPVVPETSDSGVLGVGCGPGTQAADMSFVGLMAGVVWFGLRRGRR
ncbi:MAG: hypothetical protein OXC95_07240 [Dehalococcoidia bacterium]|nr:hypothetical protein [Dehalococcoidia bacterium]